MPFAARPALLRRSSPSRLGWCLAALAFLTVTRASPAQLTQAGFTRISQPGFGDRHNSYPWSMRWFKGNLYVGTNRDFQCVENATIAFYYPIVIPLQAIFAQPDVPCPLNPAELDLRAQIWRYSPSNGQWTMIYRSDYIPGTTLAHDIGYRDMAVFTESDGTEALYAVGCTAREFNPGTPPPRILRITAESNPATGETSEVVEPIPMGDLNAVTFRATAVYKNKFYVTASTGLTGNGFVLESANPRAGYASFRQVTPPALQVYEMSVFNDYLYLGAGDQSTGYLVVKTNASGDLPYTFTPVVTGGAGRGPVMTSVVSMCPYQGRLYVGSAGWYSTLLPSSELIRINANDSWELISGNPRLAGTRLLFPLSGLGDGFGNPFNAHIWRMEEHEGILYAGTNDDSWALRTTPLAAFFRPEFGFDIFTSRDGVAFSPLTRNGFGNLYNFGLRTFESTPVGLFAGTVNYAQGTEIWLAGASSQTARTSGIALSAASTVPLSGGLQPLAGGVTPAPAARGPSAPPADAQPEEDIEEASSPPPLPANVEAESHGGDVFVSWAPQEDATEYHVYRSAYRKTDLGFLLGLGPVEEGDEDPMRPGEKPGVFAVPGSFVEIGTTTKPSFKDHNLKAKQTYAYYVRAKNREGKLSPPSNIKMIPDLGPPATFEAVRKELLAVIADDWSHSKETALLPGILEKGRNAAVAKDAAEAKARLQEIQEQLAHLKVKNPSTPPASPLDVLLSRLVRRVDLVVSGVLPAEVLTSEEGKGRGRAASGRGR